jgi:hypothetical protein
VTAGAVERVEWDEFVKSRSRWEQGQHVTLIGPTGKGKTTLALAILPMRNFVVAFGTKPKDATLDKLHKSGGWRLVRKWEQMPNILHRKAMRVVLWPKYQTPRDLPGQHYEIATALHEAFAMGSWCLFVDELWYFDKFLKQREMLEMIWTQGRSVGISLVAGTQRPAHVSLLAYDQATHVFFWRDNDERNLKRISGMNGLNAQLIRSTVATLADHDVLYVNTRTGAMTVTKAPKP